MNDESITLYFRDLTDQAIIDLLVMLDREVQEEVRTANIKAGKALAAEAWERNLLTYTQAKEDEVG